MTSVFSEFDIQATADLGATHTMAEIQGQPALWEAIGALVEQERHRLQAFLQEALADPERTIVLTGAGSSAYIGELLQGPLALGLGRSVRAVPTTDIVTHPQASLAPGGPTLLISFARSGNSPESAATLDRADETLADLRHLVITCNPEGELARHPSRHPRCVLTLPPQADDQGLAMTGSFTGMALVGALLPHLAGGPLGPATAALAQAGRRLLDQGDLLRAAGRLDFTRAIFLGSGPLLAAARESHLKVQELTSGTVICAYDSFLGLRHGPKAAIDGRTLLVYLFSGDRAVRPYEDDLLAEIHGGERGLFRLGVGGGRRDHLDGQLDLGPAAEALPDAMRAICSVLGGQILGVYRSLALGLRPDTPSPSNTISRVVRGVTIHPHPEA
jgi:tagatose-6-phosphate ketose/aldose isomerase